MPAPAGAGVLVLLLMAVLTGCGGPAATRVAAAPFPSLLAPTSIAGLTVHDEQKATNAYLQGAKDKAVIVSYGRVVSMSKNGLVQAALQVAQLKSGYTTSNPDVVHAITKSVGQVKPLKPADGHQLWDVDDGTQRIYLWFPTSSAMALLVVRSQIPAGAAEALARSLISYGDGHGFDAAALDAAFASVASAGGSGGSTGSPPVVAPPPTASPTPSPTTSTGGH